ncbi:MAG: Arylsulfatase [Flavobacteriaceae bacterium]|nr:MAG: Arylsulfatase [Flavobacteriaceae bacterium]
MKKSIIKPFLVLLLLAGCHPQDEPAPNILFVISDDQSFPHTSINGTAWVHTPGFDRIAKEGLLFNQAYTTNAKCSPSRSSILTGRNSWLLEEATNHVPNFPEKFITFPEVLKEKGYKTGFTGKGWAPGKAMKNGEKRNLIGPVYNQIKLTPPGKFISNIDYFENFKMFLKEKEEDEKFFFWVGGFEPHRAYEYKIGVNKGNKDTNSITDVPDFWPDSENVRNDMLDYAYEIEYFDHHLVKIISELEKNDLLDNTLIVVTSDNGMPFPRVKGQVYPFDNHLPLAIRWGKGIKNPGRVINDYFSFSDFAPTFLEAAGLAEEENSMAPFSGKPWGAVFNDLPNPKPRKHMIIGKERHDVGRENDQGYPVRGILKGNYFYSQNFKPERWPAGNPETGYLNTDGSPTKTEILNLKRTDLTSSYWDYAFGKRPHQELYDLENDPQCLINLAYESDYEALKNKLQNLLLSDLKKQGDPRALGLGDVFDQYPYAQEKMKNFYNRFMDGEKIRTPWVNPTDYEK